MPYEQLAQSILKKTSIIKAGTTWGEHSIWNNGFTAKPGFEAKINTYHKVLSLVRKENKKNPIGDDDILNELESCLINNCKFNVANCREFSSLGLYICMKENVPAELFHFVHEGADHVFLVIGRKPESDPSDPSTWGGLIVDPWDDGGKYYSSDKADAYFKKRFTPKYKVAPWEKYNTSYLNSLRTIDNLKNSFFKKYEELQESLKKLLQSSTVILQSQTDAGKAEEIKDHIGRLKQLEKIDPQKIFDQFVNKAKKPARPDDLDEYSITRIQVKEFLIGYTENIVGIKKAIKEIVARQPIKMGPPSVELMPLLFRSTVSQSEASIITPIEEASARGPKSMG